MFDPFEPLGLDFDVRPEPTKPDDHFNRREPPEDAWDAFAPNRFDQEDQAEVPSGRVRGDGADVVAGLLPRLASLGVWIQRVAAPTDRGVVGGRPRRIAPAYPKHIEHTLRHHPDRFPKNIRRAWRILFAAWNDRRNDSDAGPIRY